MLQKLCAQPAFTVTTAAIGVAGVCLSVSGIVLTAAAVSTASVLMAIASFMMSIAGTCIAVSAAWTLKERILERPLTQLSGTAQRNIDAPIQYYPSVFHQIGDAFCRITTLQMVHLWDYPAGFRQRNPH